MRTSLVMRELRHSYQEYYESKLAATLAKHPEIFLSVKKISAAINQILKSQSEKVLSEIEKNPIIKDELYNEKFLGRFNDTERKKDDAQHILSTMIDILNKDQSALFQIMQIHCIFIKRLYDAIFPKNNKNQLQDRFFKDLRRYQNRKENKSETKLTEQFGTIRNSVFAKLMKDKIPMHARALDRFEPVIATEKLFVAGSSGHTSALLLGAKIYGELTENEMQNYSLACFSFLTAGGNHCFHEVMSVANKAGVSYLENDYLNNLPANIVNSKEFADMKKHPLPETAKDNLQKENESINIHRLA